MSPLAHFLALPIRAYRLFLSPWMGRNCRFQPSCSAYALEALALHGPLRGGWLAARRVARCHPFGRSGIDNVPDSATRSSRSNAISTSPPTMANRDA